MKFTIVSFLLASFLFTFCLTTMKNSPHKEMELLMKRKLETNDMKKQYVAYKLYKQQYNKVETNEQTEYRRFATYMNNAEKIRKHNERYRLGKETYKMTINEFADMLPEEFHIRNGYQRTFKKMSNSFLNFVALSNVTKLPEFVDWRKDGAVSRVKNQGRCGSCWAFSATGALEGQHFRKTGKLVSLSEQNLIDCSMEYGSEGCGGGLMDQAFDYVIDNNGIDTEASYPYAGKVGNCKYKVKNRGATASRRVNLPEDDEEELRRAVATVGPISVAIDASQNLHFYGEGIYSNNHCSTTDVNHGVLVVGYGNEIVKTKNGRNKTIAYWILKNSWGSKWGEFGYFKLLSGRNMCGIATAASYPLIV